jgi:ADP-heptose:LPS heptosyltransferase
VLHPGASLPSKQWPLARWGEVAARLRAEGVRVVVVGGPEERARLAALGIDFDERTALDRVGTLDLRTLARALGEADAFAGNDSFPFHLAAAARVPSVVLVGPGAPRWTAYPVPHVTVLRDPVMCSPRDGGECPVYTTCPHGACMQNIRVAAVAGAVRAALA